MGLSQVLILKNRKMSMFFLNLKGTFDRCIFVEIYVKFCFFWCTSTGMTRLGSEQKDFSTFISHLPEKLLPFLKAKFFRMFSVLLHKS
jgi:hypothetical protein